MHAKIFPRKLYACHTIKVSSKHIIIIYSTAFYRYADVTRHELVTTRISARNNLSVIVHSADLISRRDTSARAYSWAHAMCVFERGSRLKLLTIFRAQVRFTFPIASIIHRVEYTRAHTVLAAMAAMVGRKLLKIRSHPSAAARASYCFAT